MRELAVRHRARSLSGYGSARDEGSSGNQTAHRAAFRRAARARRSRSSRCSAATCGAPRAFVETAEPLALLRDARHRHAALAAGWSCRSRRSSSTTRRAGPFLVDTGLHPSVASRPAENMGGWSPASPGRRLEPGKDLPSQLRGRGVDPEVDRPGGDDPPALRPRVRDVGVPGATFVLTEAEWIAATTDAPPVPAWLPPRPLRLRLRVPHPELRLRPGRARTRASAAPSTSSATVASGSPRLRGTAPATSR